jgi:hypothetical protein
MKSYLLTSLYFCPTHHPKYLTMGVSAMKLQPNVQMIEKMLEITEDDYFFLPISMPTG